MAVVLSVKWNNVCYRKHVHNGGFFFLFLKHTYKASFMGNKILIAVV
jgi:hypothetical protein